MTGEGDILQEVSLQEELEELVDALESGKIYVQDFDPALISRLLFFLKVESNVGIKPGSSRLD